MTDQTESPLGIAVVPVTPFQQNCSIVWCTRTKEAAIVDPGGDVERVRGALTELGVTPVAIWLTHGHIDHAGGATELAGVLNLPIIGPHEADKLLQIEKDLHEVKEIIHKNLADLLKKGEQLDELMVKSKDLNKVSVEFYKKAKKQNSKCCGLQ